MHAMNDTTATPTLRPELPPLPERMKRLKLDRGYPVPWFVAWLDDHENEVRPGEGRPEFRVMSERRLVEAVKDNRCWLCGGDLGRYKAFVIGPMCLVNKLNAEPPSHLECADFAARACPFLARPHMVRRENAMPEKELKTAGVSILRNPGVACVYVIDQPFVLKGDGRGGVLFDLPDPHEVRFYAEGRKATIEEIERSVETGLPHLLEVCLDQGERREVLDRASQALARALVGYQ